MIKKDMYNSLLSSLAKTIQEEEDKKIMSFFECLIEDIEFINKIPIEELPLYINYDFKTFAAEKILIYRIKTGKKFSNDDLSREIIKIITDFMIL